MVISNEVALIRYCTSVKYSYLTNLLESFYLVTLLFLHYVPKHKIVLFTSLHFLKHTVTPYNI